MYIFWSSPFLCSGVATMTNDLIPLVLDFETFYSTTYSLTRMSPAEYILDPQFEAICLGVANLTDMPALVDGPEIPYFIKQLRSTGKRIAMISHNAQFDMAILQWRYDYSPDLIIDTIALSRTVLGPTVSSHSLDNLAKFYDLPSKGSMVKDVKGMTRADIKASGLWKREVEYCLHDTWLCRELYRRLLHRVNADELLLHDMLTRCCTQPLLKLDMDVLREHKQLLANKKAETLAKLEIMGIGKSHLMSNNKFADVLRSVGIEPPTKISVQTGQPTFAFSKQDEEFTDLLEHPDELVRTLVEARLETKSTIETTRTDRFIKIGELDFGNSGGYGTMPMPVVIGAAHTHRVGGGWDLNVQNMGRGSRLRDAITAQDGHTLLVVDSKQIEARFSAWFCGQDDLTEQFRNGEDVYSNFACDIFGYEVTKQQVPERFVGKTGILQLGYACGWLKFQSTVRNLSKFTDHPVELTDEQAAMVVQTYRRRMHRFPATWRELDHVLSIMYSLPEETSGLEPLVKKCVFFYKDVMYGPTGLPVRFPNLHYNEEDGSWWFKDGKYERRTYGASVLETVAQHCSRCIVMGAAVRLRLPMAGLGARLVHTAHDELVFHVPIQHIEPAKMWAQLEMNRPPSWAPDLPLDCDIGVAPRYGDCK